MLIDTDTKRKQAERIRREFTKRLSQYGFRRLRTTSWIREREHLTEQIHLHLFTFDTSFRVHLSIHVRDFDEGGEALNGLYTSDGWYRDRPNRLKKNRKYLFHFNRLEDSVEQCAFELFAFYVDVGEPWFEKYRNLNLLLSDAGSPLSEGEKLALKARLTG